MAKFGARYIRFAPFAAENAEPDNAYPTYGTAIGVSKLVKVSDSPDVSEVKHYADDECDEYAADADGGDVDLEVSDIDNDLAAAVLGVEKDSNGDIAFGDDTAPYGGLGFVCCRQVNNQKKYQGIVYPKVKASMQGDEYETKGESVVFHNGKLKFRATKAKIGKWKRCSAYKATPDLAKAWVDEKLGVTVSSGTT